ncbi:MAG: TonB-dependent receptor, partial [Bacteroidota bacterium]
TIPGILVKNIFVDKGANSVLQGFESIAGQINVVLKTPADGNRLLLNTYLNSFGEEQYNANFRHRWNRWSTLVSGHLTRPANVRDRDEDTFLDVPQVERYALYNKWQYRNPNEWGKHATISLRYVQEQRQGGQTFFAAERDVSTTNAYGQVVQFAQPEFSAKLGYRLDDYHHFVLQLSGFYHDQSSVFGTTFYDAIHQNAYANAQYELNWRDHYQLKTGVSYRLQDLREDVRFSAADLLDRAYEGVYHKQEYIPGFFVENVSNWYEDRLTLITGLRWDHHHQYGGRWTPRLLLKGNLTPTTVVRASAGSGWRTLNLFAENVNILAGNRNVFIAEDLVPEAAWNYGLNLTHNTYGEHVEAQFSLDLYRTSFENQIFPDYETDATVVTINNFFGTSISNAAQMELGLAFFDRLGLKMAYNYLDVYREVDGKKQQLPFNAKHRVAAACNFEPLTKAWHLDADFHWFGQQELVNAGSDGQAERSDPYSVFNIQFTKVWTKLEVYVGCENAFDFRQLRPIRSWQNPFDPLFDPSNVWGPTKGREFHIGARYQLDYLNK